MYLRLENKTIFAIAFPQGDDGSVCLYIQKHDPPELETFSMPLRHGVTEHIRKMIKDRCPQAKVDVFEIMGEKTCPRKEIGIDKVEAAFIDRDAVLNHNDQSFEGGPVYTLQPSDVIIPEGVPDALGWLTKMGILNFVITMQNCISDGLASPWEIDQVHETMLAEWVISGGKIEGIYTCTTADEDDLVKARAKARVIKKICYEHGINVENTITIGDSDYDIEAGIIAGCGWEIQTRTIKLKKTRARTIASSFYEAVDIIWRSLHGQAS